jgi:hypothetical protein
MITSRENIFLPLVAPKHAQWLTESPIPRITENKSPAINWLSFEAEVTKDREITSTRHTSS